MPESSSISLVPRLAAEFVVIVVGVLVALGVDSWAQDRADRALEQEYVQRLLDDVRYDLDEFTFLDSIARLGLDASVALSYPETVRSLESSLLVGMVVTVSNELRPDPSRGTYMELLSSGRIDLIRSADVRVALAEYDRLILETEGIWVAVSPDLRAWALSRIPIDVLDRYHAACTSQEGDWLYWVATVCEFDLGGWSAEGLRRDVLSEDAHRRMLLSSHRFLAGLGATAELRRRAEALEDALEETRVAP